MSDNPINIFLVSFDWDDLAVKKPDQLIKKLGRDKLHPEKNRFLILSWGPGRYEKDIAPNIRVVRRSARLRFFRPLYDFLTFFIAPRVISQDGIIPDLLFAYDFPFVLALSYAKLRFKVPLILCLTNQPRLYINSRNSLRLLKLTYQILVERLASRFITRVFTTSLAMRNYALDRGIPDDRIVVYTMDTITPDKLIAATACEGFLRSRFPIPLEHKIMFSAARLEGEKGLERLIDAFSKIGRKDISLVIAGRGPLLDDLIGLAKARGVADRVFFAGHLSRAEMWRAYKDIDIFILLSRAEGLGLVFWEAMYMDVPVIGSRADGIVESIGAEERGFLWEPNDGIKALESRIDLCLNGGARERVERARAHVEKRLQNKADIDAVYNLCKGR